MKAARILLLLFVAVAVLISGARQITASAPDRDAQQSIRMAVNLAHNGVMSLSNAPPYEPSDYREPVPVALMALSVRLVDGRLGPAASPEYLGGERLKWMKYENLLWLVILCAGVFGSVSVATRSFYASLVGAALAGLAITRLGWGAEMLNDLATDLPGGALLVAGSAALATALTRGRWGWCIAAGVLFATLALVKAAILYVFIGIIGSLAAAYLIWQSRPMAWFSLRQLGLITLAFLIVVTPWMLRNLVQLGTLQIAQRGGVVLMIRAVKDGMTAEEYRGAFYVWAPASLQAPIGRLLGFTPADLQRGGRLQHLNRLETSDFYQSDLAAEQAGRPQDAIAYYRRARAERVKLEDAYEAAGVAHPDVVADRQLQKEAMGLIKAHPAQHLAATLPFMWRGAALAFLILVCAMLLALRYRRYECAILALPALGLVMFYALLSHFLPRYGLPVRPTVIALLVIGVKLAWDATQSRLATPAPIKLHSGQRG